jgi:hypothetical protein
MSDGRGWRRQRQGRVTADMVAALLAVAGICRQGIGINNSSRVREAGGESSEIVDYSVESCSKIQ